MHHPSELGGWCIDVGQMEWGVAVTSNKQNIGMFAHTVRMFALQHACVLADGVVAMLSTLH